MISKNVLHRFFLLHHMPPSWHSPARVFTNNKNLFKKKMDHSSRARQKTAKLTCANLLIISRGNHFFLDHFLSLLDAWNVCLLNCACWCFFAHILYLAYKLPENVVKLFRITLRAAKIYAIDGFFSLYIDLNSNQRKIKGLVTKRFDTEKAAI